jgi:preprotein translocase subunit SecA
MADNNREMPTVDEELYFVIEEKNNQIDLTDKGIEYLSGKDDPDFFVMPEIGMEIAKIEKLGFPKKKKQRKKKNFSVITA